MKYILDKYCSMSTFYYCKSATNKALCQSVLGGGLWLSWISLGPGGRKRFIYEESPGVKQTLIWQKHPHMAPKAPCESLMFRPGIKS